MSGAPYTWRADGGYKYGPPPESPTPSPPAPPVSSTMFYFPAPPSYLQGPLGINGVYTQQPPNVYVNVPAQPQQIVIPPPPPPQPKKEEKKAPPPPPPGPPPQKDDGKKDDKKKDDDKNDDNKKKKTNRYAPPLLPPGVNYMFPAEHTTLHIFHRPAKVWEEKYSTENFLFKVFRVDTQRTVKSMIEYIRGPSPGRCNGWAATEVIEAGDGKWSKGTTIEYTSDRAKASFESLGWTARRGAEDGLPPVWITVHIV